MSEQEKKKKKPAKRSLLDKLTSDPITAGRAAAANQGKSVVTEVGDRVYNAGSKAVQGLANAASAWGDAIGRLSPSDPVSAARNVDGMDAGRQVGKSPATPTVPVSPAAAAAPAVSATAAPTPAAKPAQTFEDEMAGAQRFLDDAATRKRDAMGVSNTKPDDAAPQSPSPLPLSEGYPVQQYTPRSTIAASPTEKEGVTQTDTAVGADATKLPTQQQALATGSEASANIAKSLVKDNGNDYLNQRYDPTQFTPEMQAPLAPLNQQRGKDGRVMPTDFRGQSPNPSGARSSRNYTLEKNMFERNDRLEARKDFANELTDNGFDMSTASKDDKKNAYARGASLGVSRKQLDNFLNPKEADRPGQQSTASGNSKPKGGRTKGGATKGGYAVTKSDPVEQGDVLGVPNRGRGGTNTYGSSGVQGSGGLSDEQRTMNAVHYKDPNKRSNDAARRDMMNNMSPNDIVPLNSPTRQASPFGTRGVSQVRGETNGPGGASGLTTGSERNMLFSQQARNNAKANKKQSRAYNLAYRQMLRQGDRVGALDILNDATDKGVSFGGVRQAGAFEQQAQDDLYRGSAGKRGVSKKRSRFF